MTNEEKAKAKEIAMINSRCYGYGLNCDSTDDCYVSAIQAMKWKDEQEIEFLQSLMFQSSTQQALNIIINNRIKLLKGQ